MLRMVRMESPSDLCVGSACNGQRALSVSEYSAVFGGPVCNRPIQLRLASRKRLKPQLVSKRRSGWWPHSPQGALGTRRRGVKAGLKAEADPRATV